MKKRIILLALGLVLCGMITGCKSSVNAEPGDYVLTEAESTSDASVPFATAVSTEYVTAPGDDIFETNGLNLTNLKTVSVLGTDSADDDGNEGFALQIYSGAEKKLNEFSYSYVYDFEGGKYEVEVSEKLKQNVSLVNCEWMSVYSEVTNYIDGTKYDLEKTEIDCSINDIYEMVYIHIDDSEYKKNQAVLEDRYYIKNNSTGILSVISVSVSRDKNVYGEGSMAVTRQYMNDVKNAVYAEFNR